MLTSCKGASIKEVIFFCIFDIILPLVGNFWTQLIRIRWQWNVLRILIGMHKLTWVLICWIWTGLESFGDFAFRRELEAGPLLLRARLLKKEIYIFLNEIIRPSWQKLGLFLLIFLFHKWLMYLAILLFDENLKRDH